MQRVSVSRRRVDRRLRPYLYVSGALHIVTFLALLIWGAAHRLPEPTPPMDVVMVEVPKGPSPDIGKGTEETLDQTEVEEPPTPQVEAPPPLPTPPPLPQGKLSDLMEKAKTRDAPIPPAKTKMAEPTKQKPVVKPPVPVARPSVPAAPPKQKSLLSQLDKLEGNLKKRAQGAASPGWKEGTGKAPVQNIPVNAVLMRYRAQVRAGIHRQWAAPGQLKDLPSAKRPRAIIFVRINASGHIVSKGWVKRSGNAFLDESAMRAVGRASPLPAPPPEIKQLVLQQGFNIDFKP